MAIPPTANGVECYQARQGDIYQLMPSLFIRERPLGVTRSWKTAANRPTLTLHLEEDDEPANPGYRWDTEETVVAWAKRGFGMVMSHDCEIDKKDPLITFAFVRLVDGSQHEDHLERIKNFWRYRFFYLAAQEEAPAFERAYVDFARLTSVERKALRPEDRIISTTDVVRKAVREWFIQFMTLERAADEG